jgi:hypothetical protein
MSCHSMTSLSGVYPEFCVPDLYRCSLPRRTMPTATAGEFGRKRTTICPNVSFRMLP